MTPLTIVVEKPFDKAIKLLKSKNKWDILWGK